MEKGSHLYQTCKRDFLKQSNKFYLVLNIDFVLDTQRLIGEKRKKDPKKRVTKTLIELSEEVKEHLLQYPIQTWCKAFFDTICKNQKVENSFTESFNSWILEARHNSIIRMLEDKRIELMNMVRDNEKEVMSWTTEWSPKALEMYNYFC
ncbi:hypothetical protein HAX54_040401 [Datura stramonium]|uniref:Uncharacterized protein n=1 Tax=Datura stramonium TaxID=4076 RepID=A0ABS8RNY9_DATST|nr:hypothetical protein [Datura stramonium]